MFFIYSFLIPLIYLTSRVITKEIATEWLRNFLEINGYTKLHYFFSCFFCMSIWVGIFLSLLFLGIEHAPLCIVSANLLHRILGETK